MELLQFLCVLFTLVASVSMSRLQFLQMAQKRTEAAQAPPCYPPQWESRLNLQSVVYSGSTKTVKDIIQLASIDYKNLRSKNTIATFVDDKLVSNITLIALYSEAFNGILYELDEITGKCSKSELQADIPTDCLLSKTKPGEKRKIGYDPVLEVHNYGFTEPGYTYEIVAQDKPNNIIIPIIMSEAYVDEFGHHVSNYYEYVNFTPSIKDASVFDEPKECKKAHSSEADISPLSLMRKFLKS